MMLSNELSHMEKAAELQQKLLCAEQKLFDLSAKTAAVYNYYVTLRNELDALENPCADDDLFTREQLAAAISAATSGYDF